MPQLLADFGRKLNLISQYKDQPEVCSLSLLFHCHDHQVMLKLGSSQKSLANEYKRSRGKQLMMRKLGLIAERRAEERALCAHGA